MPSIYFQQTYNRLADYLGRLPTDTPAPPVLRIARDLGVSRTLVNAAFKRAKEYGLIDDAGDICHENRRSAAAAGRFVLSTNASSERERVQEHFLGMIKSGRLRPGQYFTESEIACAADSAIITVREALIGLNHSGLISKQARRHWRVVPLNAERIDWATEARLLVEGHALGRLLDAPDNSPVWPVLRELQIRHLTFQAGKSIRVEDFYELDREFHRTLYRATTNDYLASFEEVMSFMVLLQSRGAKQHPRILHTACADHLKIIAAVLRRDRKNAPKLLRDHLIRAADAIKESVREPAALPL
ncbi:MAG: GntR family transcriptional regulator [Candidatus Paceibacterota bacterium]